MNSNKLVSNGVKVVLVSSLVGFGTISVPGAYASVIPNTAASGTAGSITAGTGNGSSNVDGTQESPEALTDIEVNGSKLGLSSQPATYTDTVVNNTDKISLLLKSGDPQAMIKVNDQEVQNGLASDFPLQTGTNEFTIQIESSDQVVTSTYQLIVTRQKSSDNILKDIKISAGKLSPSFQANVTAYDVNLDENTSSLIIGTELEDSTASVTVNGKKDEGNGIKVDVPQGKSSVNIKITAENGAERVYTLSVVRAVLSPGTDNGHGKKPVSNPSPSHGKGAGKPGAGGYSGKPGGYSGNPKGKPSSDTGWKGKSAPASHNSSERSFGSGSKSSQYTTHYQNMSAGTITNANSRTAGFLGTAGGGSQNNQTVNSAANLSGLTVSAGTWNKEFKPNEYTYHIALTSDIDKVTIQAVPSDSGASADIQGSSDDTIAIGADQAKTIIPIVVTKGTERKTYVLVFDKQVVTPTVKTAVTNDTDSSSSSVINTSASSNSSVINTVPNTRQNQSLSLWTRIIRAIQSFFS
ncbi:cadherin-like beta sandwich domain-containing protein [Heyndrickxia acidicola]|uniref:Cadherin-like beta sandwich domain-containing protein n=1 Tax=Heyndrickxia acidicola TaxID=209389 RepID=A0ABU6MIM0_9BACI|nr:cadherin-like beta sandwich domain-containing protein [Heyndrickxia acidicola]MED1204521.1 cadherin-like beta sandwich domain-containing protein [Heyndrickxia acidicola]